MERSSRSDEERDGPNRPSMAMSIRSPELWGWSARNVQVARLERKSGRGVGEGGKNMHGRLSQQRSKDRDDIIVLLGDDDKGGHGVDLESEEDFRISEDPSLEHR